jgi:hypothetical protein
MSVQLKFYSTDRNAFGEGGFSGEIEETYKVPCLRQVREIRIDNVNKTIGPNTISNVRHYPILPCNSSQIKTDSRPTLNTRVNWLSVEIRECPSRSLKGLALSQLH